MYEPSRYSAIIGPIFTFFVSITMAAELPVGIILNGGEAGKTVQVGDLLAAGSQSLSVHIPKVGYMKLHPGSYVKLTAISINPKSTQISRSPIKQEFATAKDVEQYFSNSRENEQVVPQLVLIHGRVDYTLNSNQAYLALSRGNKIILTTRFALGSIEVNNGNQNEMHYSWTLLSGTAYALFANKIEFVREGFVQIAPVSVVLKGAQRSERLSELDSVERSAFIAGVKYQYTEPTELSKTEIARSAEGGFASIISREPARELPSKAVPDDSERRAEEAELVQRRNKFNTEHEFLRSQTNALELKQANLEKQKEINTKLIEDAERALLDFKKKELLLSEKRKIEDLKERKRSEALNAQISEVNQKAKELDSQMKEIEVKQTTQKSLQDSLKKQLAQLGADLNKRDEEDRTIAQKKEKATSDMGNVKADVKAKQEALSKSKQQELDFDAELKKLMKKKADLEVRKDSNDQSIVDVHNTLTELKAKQNSLSERRIAEATADQKKRNELNVLTETLNQKKTDLKASLDDLSKKKQTNDELVDSLQKQLLLLEPDLSKHKEETERIGKKQQQLNLEQLNAKEIESDQKNKQATLEKITKQAARLASQSSDLEEKRKNLTDQKTMNTKAITEADKTLAGLEAKQRAQSENRRQEDAKSETELGELTRDIAAAAQNKTVLDANLTKTQTKSQTTQSTLESLTKQLSALMPNTDTRTKGDAEINAQQREYKAAQSKVDSGKVDVATKQKALDVLKAATVSAAEFKNLKDKVSQSEREKSSLEQKLGGLKRGFKSKQELNEYYAMTQAQQIKKISEVHERYKKEKSDLLKEIDSLAATLATGKDSLKVAQANGDEIKKAETEVEATKKKLADDTADATKKLNDVDATIREINERQAQEEKELAQKKADLEMQVESAKKEKVTIDEELAVLEKKKTESETTEKDLAIRKNALEEDTKKQKETRAKEDTQLTHDKNATNVEKNALMETQKDISTQLSKVDIDVEKLVAPQKEVSLKKQEAEKAFKAAESKLVEISDQVDQTRRDLEKDNTEVETRRAIEKETLAKQRDLLEGQLRSAKNDGTLLSEKLSGLQEHATELAKSEKDLIDQGKTLDVATLQRNEKNSEEQSQLSQKIESAMDQKTVLLKNQSANTAEILLLSRDVDRLKQRQEEALNAKRIAEQAFDEAATRLTEETAKYDREKKNLEDFQTLVSKLRAQQDLDLARQRSELEMDLQSISREVASFNRELANLQNQKREVDKSKPGLAERKNTVDRELTIQKEERAREDAQLWGNRKSLIEKISELSMTQIYLATQSDQAVRDIQTIKTRYAEILAEGRKISDGEAAFLSKRGVPPKSLRLVVAPLVDVGRVEIVAMEKMYAEEKPMEYDARNDTRALASLNRSQDVEDQVRIKRDSSVYLVSKPSESPTTNPVPTQTMNPVTNIPGVNSFATGNGSVSVQMSIK